MVDSRPEQATDYLYSIELAAVQYAAKGNGETNNKFIGGSGNFKKSWFKQARHKVI